MTSRSDPNRPDSGVSLLELLVVLAILALAAGLVSARIGAGQDRVTARAHARAIAGHLAEARTSALETGRSVAVDFDAARGRLETRPDGPVLSVPEGLVAGPERLLFRPEGGADGASPVGAFSVPAAAPILRVQIDGFSGEVSVVRAAP